MSLWSEQPAYCNSCGRKMNTTFHIYGGRVCGKECSEELNWRKTLAILGKPYMPKGNTPAEVPV